MVGPILDSTGVAVTTAVVGDLKISKNGAAPAALNGSATLTHRHTGHYSLSLTTSDLDTVGQAEVGIDATTNAMPIKVLTIIEEAIYDAYYAASATGLLPANVTQFGGVAGTFASGRPEVNTTHIAGSAVNTSSAQLGVNVVNAGGTAWGSGAITAASIATGAIDADALATDAVTEIWAGSTAPTAATIADAVWDEDATAHQTQGTFGQAIGDPAADTNTIYKAVVTDATGATVGADVVAVKAETASVQSDTNDIQARLPAALVSGRMDSSIGAMATDVITSTALAASAVTEIQTGLSTLDAAGVRSAVGLAVANLDTQLSTIDTVVDSILVDTAEIGVAGAGLTAINLPDQTMNITGDITGNISGSVGSVTAAVTVGALNANVITAASMNADASAEIADAVWDEDATGHQTQGTFGQAIGDPVADTNTIYKAVVTDAAGATIGVDVVAVKADTAAILIDTTEIGVAGAGLTNINLPNQTMDIVGNITGNLSGSVGSVTGNVGGNVVGSVATIGAAGIADSSLAASAQNAIADAILDRNMAAGSDSGTDDTANRTVRQALRALRNKVTVSAGTATVTKEDDTTTSWTAAVTTTSGNPMTGVDPS